MMNAETSMLAESMPLADAASLPSISEEDAALSIIQSTVTNEDVEALEKMMLELPNVHVPVLHSFRDGMYFRGITLPKGSFAIGHAHRKDCVNIVMSGCVSVLIDGEIKKIAGPAIFDGKAMQRKVGYVHEESTWLTAHSTAETDLAKLEEELIIKSRSFREYEERNGLKITHGYATAIDDETIVREDQEDFFKAIAELGFSPEEVKRVSENLGDQIALSDSDNGSIILAASQRHGMGIFATAKFRAGDLISPGRIGVKRTMAGRFTNHSINPNAFMMAYGDRIDVVCCKPIEIGSEILVDYRQARKVAAEHQKLNLSKPCLLSQ